jgi:hypothetical protein
MYPARIATTLLNKDKQHQSFGIHAVALLASAFDCNSQISEDRVQLRDSQGLAHLISRGEKLQIDTRSLQGYQGHNSSSVDCLNLSQVKRDIPPSVISSCAQKGITTSRKVL